MPSTFFGLSIGTSALNAARVSINTTAHNMSNVETVGYSRQRANQTAAIPLRTFTSYGMIGAGVTVNSVDQIRDSYYDHKYWTNQSSLGEHTAKSFYMTEVESLYFSELNSNGFTDYYSEWCNALNSLTANGSSLPIRNDVIQSGQSFAEYYNRIANSLDTYQKETNVQLEIVTDRINTIARNVASLNSQINTLELNGVTANDLRDKRNVLVDELTEFVGVTIDDYESATGSSQYKLKINNQILVDGNDFNQLELIPRDLNESRHQEDVPGMYEIKWDNGLYFDIRHPDLTGSLKGYLDIRDGDNLELPDYPTGAEGVNYKGIVFYREQTDHFVSEYARQMNMIHMQGTNMRDESTIYTPFFSISNMTAEEIKDQSQKLVDIYEELANAPTPITDDVYTNIYQTITGKPLTTAPPATADEIELAKSTYQTWAVENLDYAPEADGPLDDYVTNWVEDNAIQYAMELDPTLSKATLQGAQAGGTPALEALWRKTMNQYLYVNENGMDTDGYLLDATGNPITDPTTGVDMNFMPMVDYISENISAKTMSVNHDLIANNDLMATASEITNGIDRPDVITLMSNLRDKKVFTSGTAEAYMQGIVAYSSIDSQTEKNLETSHTFIGNAITNQRLSVSGVDKDEEAVDLVMYQEAYDLAAKIISTMQELYDTLINRTGL